MPSQLHMHTCAPILQKTLSPFWKWILIDEYGSQMSYYDCVAYYNQQYYYTNLRLCTCRFDSEMREYIQELSDKVANKNQSKREIKPITGRR